MVSTNAEFGLGLACGAETCTELTAWAGAIQADRVWTNCYHAYPAHAAFGGYKKSGVGRETHKMALEHDQQTKNFPRFLD